jgi:23S rRNA pseudouridine1911/1915/1917 synthase
MIRTGKKFSKPAMSRVINGDTELKTEQVAPEKVRLDHMMVKIFKSYNRSTLQKFIESGFVRVDKEVVTKPNQKFEEGVRIDLEVPSELKNADLEPEVLYEDNDVLVVSKPAGMLSEPRGEYCPEKTLGDYGLVVHRLDRDTSGVVILAKNEDAKLFLKKQFQDRKVHKTYNAIVVGRPKLDKARIDLPLIRNLKRPTTFLVDANGKEAETFYEVKESDGNYSLMELKPTTGRTHQLRVHMKYLGHPILGDLVYGEAISDEGIQHRLYLHARTLELILPNGEKRIFESSLPREFGDVFKS